MESTGSPRLITIFARTYLVIAAVYYGRKAIGTRAFWIVCLAADALMTVTSMFIFLKASGSLGSGTTLAFGIGFFNAPMLAALFMYVRRLSTLRA